MQRKTDGGWHETTAKFLNEPMRPLIDYPKVWATIEQDVDGHIHGLVVGGS